MIQITEIWELCFEATGKNKTKCMLSKDKKFAIYMDMNHGE